jgi:hypothetical protein
VLDFLPEVGSKPVRDWLRGFSPKTEKRLEKTLNGAIQLASKYAVSRSSQK